MNNRVEESYKKIYKDLQFERADVFKAISQKYKIDTVLYPGSNIHVTPSFFFQNVIYVDIAGNAVNFFADSEQVLELIKKNKTYKPAPYIQFINQDFTKPLSIRRVDLVIALFAGGISASCAKYLRKGGFLLTNNHHQDAMEAMNSYLLTPKALISRSKGKYQLIEANAELFTKNLSKNTNRLLNNNPEGGLRYQENEAFFLFQRIKD